MVSINNERILLKTLAVAAIATLVFMALSFMLAPNEGAYSAFVLKLKGEEDEDRIKGVGAAPGSHVTYEMQLYNAGPDDGGTHEISLEVANAAYSDGSMESHWTFEFIDANDFDGKIANYIVGPNIRTVRLMVTFQGNTGGEIVTFTIIGKESAVGDRTPDDNYTHLSPKDGVASEIEYLTVYSTANYVPWWEPYTPTDREEYPLPEKDTYTITIRNLGASKDDLSISHWEVWQDVNGDGKINEDVDVLNENFNVTFTTLEGAPFPLNEEISLDPGNGEELLAKVTPRLDNELVPVGHYMIKLTVYSKGGGSAHEDFLKARMSEIALPDFSIVTLDISKDKVEEGKTVELKAGILIDWNIGGEVAYAFYVDDEVIDGAEGSINFTKIDAFKEVTAKWKASGTGSRTISVKVDPDNVIREKNETNNEMAKEIKVTAKGKAFPWGVVSLVIVVGVIAVSGFWLFLLPIMGGDLEVIQIYVDPEEPVVGKATEIKAVVKNKGGRIKGDKHEVVVSFYTDYEPIGEETIDLTEEDFERGDIREVTIEWEPSSPELHTLNVAVDLDEEEHDVDTRDVEVREEE
ncbi:MAG: hypothetical protein KAU14_01040 [Thermoplasmata archaeon]|nr:hypothetical protein [Thermoplasmata archaeon]